MARFIHTTTGVVVNVRDDKTMGRDWKPFDGSAPKRRRSPAKKAAAPKADAAPK